MSSTSAPLPVLSLAGSVFSYTCNACNRCCYDKRIHVNPHEIARLASALGLRTTEVIDRYTDDGGVALGTRDDGSCVFLGAGGCTVHADRPLVCRLYPLGRGITPAGAEVFMEVEPHPESAGVWGEAGTVAEYLAGQAVEEHTRFSDLYYELFLRLKEAIQERDGAGTEHGDGFELDPATIQDIDLAIAGVRVPVAIAPADVTAWKAERHLALLHGWVDGRLADRPAQQSVNQHAESDTHQEGPC
jgi:uncharacterized protein